MNGEGADPALWPGKTLITAASFEAVGSISEEDGETVAGFGGRASLGCVGAFARHLILDASLGYRWIEGPEGPIPFPGAALSAGRLFSFHGPVSLTPFGGISVDLRFENYDAATVTGLFGGVRLALLLSERDYLTLTPSIGIPLSGDAAPLISLALGMRSERAWMRPVPDREPGIKARPALFSPDGDGEADETVFRLSCADRSLVTSWTVSVFGREGTPITTWSGTNKPPRSITWKGEPDPAAMEPGVDYRVVFETVDVLGRRMESETTVTCDILVIRDGDRYRVRVPYIHFPSDSWEILPGESQQLLEDNRLVLERVASLFSHFPSYILTVEGYANAVYRNDPARYAEEQKKELLPLSQKRADTVRDALIMLGIDSSRINTKAYGGERPKIIGGDTQEAWKNRRVEFILQR